MFTLQIQLDDSLYLQRIAVLAELIATDHYIYSGDLFGALAAVVDRTQDYAGSPDTRKQLLGDPDDTDQWRRLSDAIRRLADTIDRELAESE